ncbi:uncharacterized protein PRCAT00002454001 [Priceomyces carsonii]|uniref:uncharacterized protein n=1 Tax=Priceomyces carsonii TaxID=28549 RepID=UPI002ED94A93|nr:unnamed protein product [Priceomyces carsonii]
MSSSSSLEKSPSAKHETMHSFMGMRGPRLNFAVSVIAGVGFLLFGYDQGVMGSLLTLESFRHTLPEIDVQDNPSRSTLQGFVIALYELGCMSSALSTIYLGDKLGRLRIIFLGAIIMTIGGALQSCAYTLAHFIVARVVTGIGNGFITSTVPVWQAEASKSHMRGKLIMMEGSLIALGITISYWVDFALYFAREGPTHDVSWRFPIAFQCVFGLILIACILKFPESPRWLLKKNRENDARVVFSAMYDLPDDDPLINAQIDEVKQSIATEVDSGLDKFSLKSLFTQGEKRNFHRACLAFCVQMMQQISGINLITYYAGTIFEVYIGMPPKQSKILAACNGTEYFLASLIGFWTIERLGRRFLLIWGAVGMSVTMAILTATNWKANPDFKNLDSPDKDSKAAIASAVFLFVFNSCFGITYLGGTWLVPPEILPLGIRAPGAALSTAANWIFNFLIVMITPPAFTNIGPYTYTIFAVINALMVPVVYFLYPETKGRSLEEMDIIFGQCPVNQPWKVVQIANDLPYMHAGANNNEDIEDKPKGSFEHDEKVSVREEELMG